MSDLRELIHLLKEEGVMQFEGFIGEQSRERVSLTLHPDVLTRPASPDESTPDIPREQKRGKDGLTKREQLDQYGYAFADTEE